MIDSNSVLESGIMNGNVQFFGEFDQCLDLNIDQLPNGQIQYCSIQFPTSIILTKNEVFLNHFFNNNNNKIPHSFLIFNINS